MPTNPTRATAWLRLTLLIVIGVLWLPFAATPTTAQDLAGSPLAVGAPAQIVFGNGQDVLLRAAPGYDQMVVNGYGEGTPVEVIEGPLTAADGSTWFGVVVNGEQGYLAADFLAATGATPPAAAIGAKAAAAPAPAPELAADDTQELTAAQPAAPVAGDAFATSDLNLRAGPSADAAILLVIPGGAPVAATGEAGNGYLGVVYNGQTGWADGAFIGAGAPLPDTTMATTADPASGFTGTEEVTAAQPAAAPADSAPLVGDLAAAPGGASAAVTVLANLRGGPSAEDAILRVLPAGSQVTVTGEATNGYIPVWYNGTSGWLSTQAIDGSGQPAATDQPAAAPVTDQAGATGARTTLEPVNIRAGAAIAAEVIGVIPGGVALTPLAGPESGFYQVSYDGVTGWVSGAYLREDAAAGAEPTSAYAPGPGLEPAAAAGGGLIWPVAGGNWTIMQGYNGSSHQDNSSTWQYYYSLDLVRANGDTAGQPVLAPTAGTVRWQDPSTGGISIDIGNGHAVAMFHIAVDPGLRDGTAVRPGQVIGHISGPGEAGFAGTPHLHLALWQTTDGGNWSRSSVPFAGAYAIGGQEFPDIGGANQHRGTVINV